MCAAVLSVLQVVQKMLRTKIRCQKPGKTTCMRGSESPRRQICRTFQQWRRIFTAAEKKCAIICDMKLFERAENLEMHPYYSSNEYTYSRIQYAIIEDRESLLWVLVSGGIILRSCFPGDSARLLGNLSSSVFVFSCGLNTWMSNQKNVRLLRGLLGIRSTTGGIKMSSIFQKKQRKQALLL